MSRPYATCARERLNPDEASGGMTADAGPAAPGDNARHVPRCVRLPQVPGLVPGDARFCPQCGVPLAAAAGAGGERRQVAIVFADLSGSTALSNELGAEEMHRLLSRYFELVDGLIGQCGGTIDKHIGDAVMARVRRAGRLRQRHAAGAARGRGRAHRDGDAVGRVRATAAGARRRGERRGGRRRHRQRRASQLHGDR